MAWTDPHNAGILHYERRISSDGGTNWGAWTEVANSGAATVTATIGNLSEDLEYSFQVRAVTIGGGGPDSDTVTATPLPVDGIKTLTFGVGQRLVYGDAVLIYGLAIPSAPTGFGTTSGDGQVRLSWEDPNNSSITHYDPQVDDGDWVSRLQTDATTTSYTVTGLTNDTTYAFKLRAINSVGNGVAVGPLSGTPRSLSEKQCSKRYASLVECKDANYSTTKSRLL